jgi:hypothetical protein
MNFMLLLCVFVGILINVKILLFLLFSGFLASFHQQSRIVRNIVSHTVLLSTASYQTFCKFSFVVFFLFLGCLAIIS